MEKCEVILWQLYIWQYKECSCIKINCTDNKAEFTIANFFLANVENKILQNNVDFYSKLYLKKRNDMFCFLTMKHF